MLLALSQCFFHAYERYHTNGQSFFFSPSREHSHYSANSRLASLKNRVCPMIRITGPRKCDTARRRRDSPLSFACVSEIYNNQARFCHAIGSRRPVVVARNRKNASVGGSDARVRIIRLYVSRSLRATEKETDRQTDRRSQGSNRFAINANTLSTVKLSHRARMYTRIHSFVLRAYAYHLLVS